MPHHTAPFLDFVERPGRTIAGCLALSAFSIAMIVGLCSGHPASDVMSRAIVSLVGAYIFGLIAGGVAQSAIEEDLREIRAAHPVPDSSTSIDELVDARRSGSDASGSENVAPTVDRTAA